MNTTLTVKLSGHRHHNLSDMVCSTHTHTCRQWRESWAEAVERHAARQRQQQRLLVERKQRLQRAYAAADEAEVEAEYARQLAVEAAGAWTE